MQKAPRLGGRVRAATGAARGDRTIPIIAQTCSAVCGHSGASSRHCTSTNRRTSARCMYAAPARTRYAWYRDRGYGIRNHDLAGAAGE